MNLLYLLGSSKLHASRDHAVLLAVIFLVPSPVPGTLAGASALVKQ